MIIQRIYSAVYGQQCEVILYRKTIGIYLNGEFLIFLSRNYIYEIYGVDVSLIDEKASTLYLPYSKIRDLVKKEKKTRVKLNISLRS